MVGRTFATCLGLFALLVGALASSSQDGLGRIESWIAQNKEAEAKQNELLNGLKRGTIVVIRSQNDFRPETTEKIRRDAIDKEVLREASKSNPDFDAATKRGLAAASKTIRAASGYSKAYRKRVEAQLSAIRTERQKLEKRREQLLTTYRTGVAPTKGNFSGTWTTDFGKVVLTQSGNKVSGTYDSPQGTIDGTVEPGGKLRFKWVQTSGHGVGEFVLGADGMTFYGTWHYTGANGEVGIGGNWKGKRDQ